MRMANFRKLDIGWDAHLPMDILRSHPSGNIPEQIPGHLIKTSTIPCAHPHLFL